MIEEDQESYDKRKYADTDNPLREKFRKRKCIVCGSAKTVLLYEHRIDYTDDDGRHYDDHLREFKCLECGKYIKFQKLDTYREYYTR